MDYDISVCSSETALMEIRILLVAVAEMLVVLRVDHF